MRGNTISTVTIKLYKALLYKGKFNLASTLYPDLKLN